MSHAIPNEANFLVSDPKFRPRRNFGYGTSPLPRPNHPIGYHVMGGWAGGEGWCRISNQTLRALSDHSRTPAGIGWSGGIWHGVRSAISWRTGQSCGALSEKS